MVNNKILVTKLVIATVLILAGASTSLSHTSECREEWPGHKVRSVKVKARWLPSDLALPLKKGDDFTPEKLSATRLAVIDAIKHERDKYETEFIKLNRLQLVEVSLVRACGRKVAAATCRADGLGDNCIDLELTPLALSTNPVFMGATLLPLPRSRSFTFLSGVPRLLRIFDPKFGMSSDRKLGATPQVEFSTDLLSMGEVAGGEPAEGRPVQLLLQGRGSKSLSGPFYTSEEKLSLVLKQPTPLFESLGVEASFTADHEPQLDASFLRNSFGIRGHAAFTPATGIVNRVALNGGYRHSRNRLDGVHRMFLTENSYEGSAIVDGRILNGFTRAGLWLDGGKPRNAEAYHRIAALIGYENELPVGDETIGIEALFGAGKASKDAPEYSLFYGGNSLNNFIYEEITDPKAHSFLPSGPLLRGFGRNQAGFRLPNGERRGAHGYHHFNLTVAIPIPGLSAPLIPNEVVNRDTNTTLRDLIDLGVNSGQEALSSSYEDEGLSSKEADDKAAKVFSQIKPGVNYLTRYAKIYSLKPLLMFDEARMTRRDSADAQSRYGVGGGLQLTIVIAKFQVGYIHAVNRFAGEKRGNFVFHMVFSNLF